jgi:hypothetical protein
MVAVLYRRFLDAGLGTDFPPFYSAAKIVAAGMGHHLYDIPLQWQFQQRYTGRVGNFFIHPPFETLFYLPFAGMSMAHAYLGWTLLSVVALSVTAWLFTRRMATPGSAALTLALFLLFAPVTLNLMQGQDAILLLLAFSMAAVAVCEEKPLAGGCLLALGLFKFQFALPAALILLRRGRARFVAGFAAVAIALVLISAAISGWSSFPAYWHLLFGFDQLPFSGFHPGAMANLRGICLLFFHSMSGIGNLAMIAMSVIVIGIAIDGWRRTTKDAESLALSNTVLAAVLASYQASPHDLTLLLLPIFLTFSYLRKIPEASSVWRLVTYGLLGVLFVPLVYAYALRLHLYVAMAIPILALFGMNYWEMLRAAQDRSGGIIAAETPGLGEQARELNQ